MRRSSCLPVVLTASLLLSVIAGCGEQDGLVTRLRYELQAIYREPYDSDDPALVFARDLLCLNDRLYVLDGRLSHVAILDRKSGELLGRFGGIGAGPGELGQYPYALLTDGRRVGVAHLYQVSWFTPSGEFLELEQIPALDMATPSLQFSSGGWLFNASYHGPGSPVALLISETGDSLEYGTAVPSGSSAAFDLASVELNAVQVCRFENGNVLLGWSQKNLIEVLSYSDEVVASDSWSHLSDRLERRADGRLKNLPAYTFNATLGADGLAYLLDGSLRVVRAYDQTGRLRFEHLLNRPAIKTIWPGGGLAYAIDGSDTVYRLRLLGEADRTGAGESPGPDMNAASDNDTRPDVHQGRLSSLPGRIVERVEDIQAVLNKAGIARSGHPAASDSRPGRVKAVGGSELLYLGYDDGLGVLLSETDSGEWEIDSVVSPHPEGSLRSRVYMAGDLPFLADPRSGLYSLINTDSGLRWAGGVWPSGMVWIEGDRWLIHDSLENDSDPLFTVGLSDGKILPAGGLGSHGKAGLFFKSAYNWWWLVRWNSEKILVFDESHPRFAFWSEDGLSEWLPVSGTSLRSIEDRKGNLIPERDVNGIVPCADLGLLVYRSDFDGESATTRVLLLLPDGSFAGEWTIPLEDGVRSMTTGPNGRIFLNSDSTLYEWENLENEIRERFRSGNEQVLLSDGDR